MAAPELETISLFSKEITLDLTINQISKKLNKSYAFTNKYIRDFINDGILKKKIVGSAILCSLNFSSEKTLGLLMMQSIEDKTNFLKNADKKKLENIETLKKAPSLKSLFLSSDKFYIICDDKVAINNYLISKSRKQENIVLMDSNEFKLTFRNIDFKSTTIIEGYEVFWKLIAQMM